MIWALIGALVMTQPTGAPKEYGPPPVLPSDLVIFPQELASDIDTPSWPRRFAAAFRFKTGTALKRVASIVLPVAPLSLFNPEDFFPDDALGVFQGNSPGQAAGVAGVAFQNAAGSGLLVIVEEFQAQRMTTAGPFILNFGPTAPNIGTWAASPSYFRDYRFGYSNTWPTKSIVSAINQTTQNPPLPPSTTALLLPCSGAAQNPLISRKEFILSPGVGLCWVPCTPASVPLVNEPINIVVYFRVRVVDPGLSQKTPIG